MKKSNLSILLLFLLFGCVSCTSNKKNSNSTTQRPSISNSGIQSSTSTSIHPQENEIASFDFSSVVGEYDASLPDRGIDLKGDITNLFVNQTQNSNLNLVSVIASEKGVEKSQVSQGHKEAGIKLNGKNNGFITLELDETIQINKIELKVYSWSMSQGDQEKFNLAINDENQLYEGSNDVISITKEISTNKTIKISSSLESLTNSRPVIRSIKLFQSK